MAKKDKILKKAQKFIHKGSYDKAVVEYKSLIDMDSGDVSVRLRLGDLYVKTGQLEEAVKEYTSAAKSNARRGFYLKAIAVYKRVLTIEKNSTDTHYKLAELYTKQRLIADAMSQYTIILNHFEQKGLDSEELDILQKMVQLDPTNLSIKLKLADMYRKLDFIDDAFGMYRLVCGKLFEAGNYKKAEDIYQELYGHYPEEPRVLKGLVDVYREKGDDDELLTYASLLLQHHVQSGELDEGLEVSKKILDLRPDDAESLSFLESYGPEELTDDHHGPDVDMEEEEVVEPASVVTHDDLMVSEPEAEAEEEEVLEEEAAEEEEELEISLEGFEDGVSEVTEGAEAEESRETGEIEETIESGEEEYVSLDIPGLDGDVLDKEPLPPGNATPLYGHEERLVDEEEPPTLEDKGEGAFPSEADVSEGEPHDEVEASREEEAAGELDSDEESGEIESIDVLAESFLEEERTSDDIAQIDSEAETEIEADIDFIEEGFGDEDEQPDDGGSDAQSALEHDLGEEPQPTEGSGNEEDAEQEGSLDEEFFEGLDGDGEPALEAEAGEEQEAVEALDTSLEEEAAEDGESSPLEELLEEEPSEDHEPDDVPQSFDEDRGESEVVELISATAEEETLLEEETTAPELETPEALDLDDAPAEEDTLEEDTAAPDLEPSETIEEDEAIEELEAADELESFETHDEDEAQVEVEAAGEEVVLHDSEALEVDEASAEEDTLEEETAAPELETPEALEVDEASVEEDTFEEDTPSELETPEALELDESTAEEDTFEAEETAASELDDALVEEETFEEEDTTTPDLETTETLEEDESTEEIEAADELETRGAFEGEESSLGEEASSEEAPLDEVETSLKEEAAEESLSLEEPLDEETSEEYESSDVLERFDKFIEEEEPPGKADALELADTPAEEDTFEAEETTVPELETPDALELDESPAEEDTFEAEETTAPELETPEALELDESTAEEDTFEAEETAAPELETPDVSHLEDGTSFDIEPLEEEEEAPFDIEPVLEDEPAAEAGVLNDDEPLDEFETFAEEDIFEDEDRPLDLETPAELERDDEPQEAVEPIEIYTEPELEEAIQNLARSSSAGDVYETYEELKTGFEKQLSAEDAGTHFNLGKEYLEMELFKEASREFKIALKDKNLGLDCYINLAACAISEASYEEAIIYYLKVLKAFNGSDAKRKGFLYDLATAYDASGQEREAEAIFNSIYEGDPRFRDVAKKIKKSRTKKMSIPLNDSIIEVELL